MKLMDRIRKWRQNRRERADSETWAERQRKSERRECLVSILILALVLGGMAYGLIRYPSTNGFKTEFYEGHKYVIYMNSRTDVPVHAPDCPCRKGKE